MVNAVKLVSALFCTFVFRSAFSLIFKRVTLIGGGWIGSGLAIRFAKAGCEVTVVETPKGMANAKKTFKDKLDLLEQKMKKIDAKKRKFIEGQIRWTTDYKVACSPSPDFGPDLVIDATTEDKRVKKDAHDNVRVYLAEGVPFLSVSSALDLLGIGYDGGFHPMTPSDINRGLEIVYHAKTSTELKWKMWVFGLQVGLVPFYVRQNHAGFAVNGIFIPLMLEVCRMLEEKFSMATIEAAFIEAFGTKVGGFKIMNAIGVPVAKLAALPMKSLGKWLVIPDILTRQIDSGEKWDVKNAGDIDTTKVGDLAHRLRGVMFANAHRVVGDVDGGWHNLDRAIRVCLQWPKGPGELMQEFGGEQLSQLIQAYVDTNDDFPDIEPPEDESFESFYAAQHWVVEIDDESGVGSLMLNNPEGMGALSAAILEELKVRIKQLEEMGCRVCLVWSACGNFAGADIKEMDQMTQDQGKAHMELGSEVFGLFRQSGIIFIGVPHGKAVCGGGAELHLSLDLVVTTDTTGFWFPEPIAIGGIPGWDGILNLVRSVGSRKAATALFQPANTFKGADAVQIGFANVSVEPAKLKERLDILVDGLLQASPEALPVLKEIFREAADQYAYSDVDVSEATADRQGDLFADPEGKAQNRMGIFTRRIREPRN